MNRDSNRHDCRFRRQYAARRRHISACCCRVATFMFDLWRRVAASAAAAIRRRNDRHALRRCLPAFCRARHAHVRRCVVTPCAERAAAAIAMVLMPRAAAASDTAAVRRHAPCRRRRHYDTPPPCRRRLPLFRHAELNRAPLWSMARVLLNDMLPQRRIVNAARRSVARRADSRRTLRTRGATQRDKRAARAAFRRCAAHAMAPI